MLGRGRAVRAREKMLGIGGHPIVGFEASEPLEIEAG